MTTTEVAPEVQPSVDERGQDDPQLVLREALLRRRRRRRRIGVGALLVAGAGILAFAVGGHGAPPSSDRVTGHGPSGSRSIVPSGTATTSSSLLGKRIPGTGTDWQPIRASTSPNLAGTVTPPIVTYDTGAAQLVVFFEFANPQAAAAFYANPQPAAQRFVTGPQALLPLGGHGPVSSPSRWLNLSWCIWTGGPNPKDIPRGAPFAAPTPAGTCVKGAPESTTIASITQRGDMVFFVFQPGTPGPGVFDIHGGATPVVGDPAYADLVTQNEKLSAGVLSLLHSVGVS